MIENQSLQHSKIIASFSVIINPGNPNESIKEADNFLRECENNPEFALSLMQIFAESPDRNTQWQVLIHLNNVIKRNWTSKRRVHDSCSLNEKQKQSIKNGLIELYKKFWKGYYKEFNQMFKFLSKYEFPSHYPALKGFILEILGTLAKSDIEAVISPEELLPYLSLVKSIFKQNSNRKFLHSQEAFVQHIEEPMTLSLHISQKINAAIASISQTGQPGSDLGVWRKLLQCSRKIDKIILYCLQCIVSSMQNQPRLKEIIAYMVEKLATLIKLVNPQLEDELNLNKLALLEGLSKLQLMFPFLFSNALSQYIHLLISALFSPASGCQKLQTCLLTSNSKCLTTFAYYSSPQQFKESIDCKKGHGINYIQEQNLCHRQWMDIYGGTHCVSFMERVMAELMHKYADREDSGHMFEEDPGYTELAEDKSGYELVLVLIKNLMERFKEEFKGFVLQIFNHLIGNNLVSTSSRLALNMYEVVLTLPKVYDEPNLQLDKVSELLEFCYMNKDFQMFARLIRAFNSYLNEKTLVASFKTLTSIISQPSVSHQIVFQCAVCVKKMLSEYEESELPLHEIGGCLSNLLSLVSIYKSNPTHLWSILQLITQILKIISTETVMQNLQCITANINPIIEMRDNQENMIEAVSDLLQNVLEFINPEQNESMQVLEHLYETAMKLIGSNIGNHKIETPEFLYKLWLSVAKNTSNKNSQNLIGRLLQALHTLRPTLLTSEPVIFLELMEQYVLGGILVLNPQELLSVAQQALAHPEVERKNQILMAFFSLYFTCYTCQGVFVEELLVLAMENIVSLHDFISHSNNILRTFLMTVLNHHLIQLGCPQFLASVNKGFQGGVSWLPAFIWSLEYLNHKYSSKVASIAILSSIDFLVEHQLLAESLAGEAALEKIMKSCSFQLDPISLNAAVNSYSNAFKMMLKGNEKRNLRVQASARTGRKFKFHIKTEWTECDLSQVYRDKFSPIVQNLGWSIETIDQKFDKLAAARICAILTGNKEQNS